MRYLELKEHFKDFVLFSLQDIRKFDRDFHRRRLSEWKEKGYIENIISGFYTFSGQKHDEKHLFFMANQIYKPSYISLETALSYYNFIPEAVFAVMSVSTKKTKSFPTRFGKMIYRHIHPGYFFGYELVEFDNLRFKIATPEKAVLDFLYLNTHLEKKEDMKELRFNAREVGEKVAQEKFREFLSRFKKKSLHNRAMRLMEAIRHA